MPHNKMRPVRDKTIPKRVAAQRNKSPIKDPIEVFCRIRPTENINDVVCIRAKDFATVVMTPPDTSARGILKEVHYTFKHVFTTNTSQKTLFDHICLPLIKDLLNGANGLLFTYGITSSGKTHTMTGSPLDSGVLPRTLDVIFNSLQDHQAAKFVFKPDRLNGFEIQSNMEALAEQQQEAVTAGRVNKPKRRELISDWGTRVVDDTKIDITNTDNGYAVFISYVEIYNNYVYDLLEEVPAENYVRSKPLQAKFLREDASKNMYVFQVTEFEVKNADDALEVYSRGQLRRRISHTALNAESSRSHSVFTIRVAQAPLDSRGAEVIQDKNFLTVSQISLVDLAGSERSTRTKNVGAKLKEAGSINTSLMALRTCIEILRENQSQCQSKMVPYRESKLTHLFKTFFEGEGKIRMVVCVNPRLDDFDETTYVMKFSEMTQDVLISRTPTVTPINLGMRMGRGNLYKEALNRANEGAVNNREISYEVYNMGPEFPDLKLNNPDDETIFLNLIECLTARSACRRRLQEDIKQKEEAFRENLLQIEKESLSVKQEKTILQMDLNAREQQVRDLERKVFNQDESLRVLRQRLASSEKQTTNMKSVLSDRDQQLLNHERENEKLKNRMQDRLQNEKERMKKIMEKRLAEKQAELERKMCLNEERFRQLREILNTGEWEYGADLAVYPTTSTAPSSTLPETIPKDVFLRSKTTLGPNLRSQRNVAFNAQIKATSDPHVDQSNATEVRQNQIKTMAVANPRHRRSQSSSGDVWLEHKPIGCLEFGTVLQPKMKKKKSVSKLEVKDVTKDVSKYVLTHQEQDSKGEVETQLYKGDVIPSAGGGAQVIFNDVEKLTQESPPRTKYNFRKRSAEDMPTSQVVDRCAVATECHGVPSKVVRRAK